MLDNTYVRVTNNFLHDMGTGLWAACLLVLFVLERRLGGMVPEAVDAISSAMDAVFMMLLIALVVIAVTGALRLFYWRSQTPREEFVAKRKALIVKHVAFLVVYGGGTLWAWTMLP